MTFQEKIDELMDLYVEIKREIQQNDKRQYERWKAGGFCIDPDILSMYPNLQQIAEKFVDDNRLE